MSGSNPLSYEADRSKAARAAGFNRTLVMPLGAWTLDTGATIGTTAANVAYRAAVATNLRGISFDAAADQADIVRLDWMLPDDFHVQVDDSQGKRSHLQLLVKYRLTGTGTNTDLTLRANAQWHNAGWSETANEVLTEGNGETALNTLAADLQQAVNPVAVEAAEESIRLATFDYTAAMTAAQRKALRPLGLFQFYLFPHETVGTNLRLDVLGTAIRYRAHARPYYKAWNAMP